MTKHRFVWHDLNTKDLEGSKKFAEQLKAGKVQTSLLDTLLHEAHGQAQALFCELSPDTEVAADGSIRASSRPALAYLQQRAKVTYPFGCARRTFVLSPRGWLQGEAARQLDPTRQMHLEGADAHTYICEELAGLSLGQTVQHLAHRHEQIMDVVDHLHSRVDIAWTTPAQIEVE